MIRHVISHYEPHDPVVRHRQMLAQSSWADQPWQEIRITDDALPRLFSERMKRLPFIRDLFDLASADCPPEAILLFSNADIGFCSNAAFRVVLALQANDAGYAFRRDLPPRQTLPTDEEISEGKEYAGTDVFFFRVGWWTQWRERFPDMLIGREAWDACLRVLIEDTNRNKPLAISDLVWHVRHGGNEYWETPATRYTLPGQLHNLRLARTFLRTCNRNPANFGIR